MNLVGTKTSGQTIIEFKRKLNTGDKFDKAFVPGQNVSMIWAMADTDVDQQKHNIAKGEGIMELQDGEAKNFSVAAVSIGEKQGIGNSYHQGGRESRKRSVSLAIRSG
jgi:hypothetical protein